MILVRVCLGHGDVSPPAARSSFISLHIISVFGIWTCLKLPKWGTSEKKVTSQCTSTVARVKIMLLPQRNNVLSSFHDHSGLSSAVISGKNFAKMRYTLMPLEHSTRRHFVACVCGILRNVLYAHRCFCENLEKVKPLDAFLHNVWRNTMNDAAHGVRQLLCIFNSCERSGGENALLRSKCAANMGESDLCLSAHEVWRSIMNGRCGARRLLHVHLSRTRGADIHLSHEMSGGNARLLRHFQGASPFAVFFHCLNKLFN